LVMAPTESGSACTLSTLRSPRCAAARLEGTLRNFTPASELRRARRTLILQALVQGFDAQIDLLTQCRRCLSAPLTEESPLSPVRSGPLRRDTIEHRWHDVRAPEESLRPCIREDFRSPCRWKWGFASVEPADCLIADRRLPYYRRRSRERPRNSIRSNEQRSSHRIRGSA
jgi:hypothetical protein